MEELLNDSRDVIGDKKADEILTIQSLESFFSEVIRYTILNDHTHGTLYSPDLSDILLSAKVPTATKSFLGRKEKLKKAASLLQEYSLLFVTGIAGIGKSEFSKFYAHKNKKKYTNILFFHYEGSLKKCIAGISFSDDTVEMTEEDLFQSHYQILKKLRSDSLIILDNINVLPKDDAFFKEFIRNDFQILITTRCKVAAFQTLDIKELDREKELTTLFYQYCPSAKNDPETTADIIAELKGYTLAVCLAALSLSASGMEPEELLLELRTCGLNIRSGETVELYKDEEFSEALMIEHLRKLLQLNQMNPEQIDILRNLSLLPVSGVLKNAKEYEQASEALSFYEMLVLEHEGDNTFDYAICQLGKGIIFLSQNDPVHAELHLLDAEQRIVTIMGTDSDYSKTTYRYLHNLYSRWHKQENALEYKRKLLQINSACNLIN